MEDCLVKIQQREKTSMANIFDGVKSSHFTKQIRDKPLLTRFKMPHMDPYDGMVDLVDHAHVLRDILGIQQVSDAILCRVFPTTLRGAIRVCLFGFAWSSISSLKELSQAFCSHYVSRRKRVRDSNYLMTLYQWIDESLRSYVQWFFIVATVDTPILQSFVDGFLSEMCSIVAAPTYSLNPNPNPSLVQKQNPIPNQA